MPLAIEDGDAAVESDSSSSSSSSSSHRRKKKSKKAKKAKKTKKCKNEKKAAREEGPAERKAREALEKAREKEEQKRLDAVVKGAHEIAKKLPTVLGPLRTLIGDEGFADVAPVIRNPVSVAAEKFEGVLALAHRTVAAGAKNSDAGDAPAFSTLATEIASAKKSSFLLSSILATMAKAART